MERAPRALLLIALQLNFCVIQPPPSLRHHVSIPAPSTSCCCCRASCHQRTGGNCSNIGPAHDRTRRAVDASTSGFAEPSADRLDSRSRRCGRNCPVRSRRGSTEHPSSRPWSAVRVRRDSDVVQASYSTLLRARVSRARRQRVSCNCTRRAGSQRATRYLAGFSWPTFPGKSRRRRPSRTQSPGVHAVVRRLYNVSLHQSGDLRWRRLRRRICLNRPQVSFGDTYPHGVR